MFAVKLANFIMFSVSEGGFFGHLWQWSDLFVGLIFESLRQSLEMLGSLWKSEINCRKMAENSFIY